MCRGSANEVQIGHYEPGAACKHGLEAAPNDLADVCSTRQDLLNFIASKFDHTSGARKVPCAFSHLKLVSTDTFSVYFSSAQVTLLDGQFLNIKKAFFFFFASVIGSVASTRNTLAHASASNCDVFFSPSMLSRFFSSRKRLLCLLGETGETPIAHLPRCKIVIV